MDRQTKENSAKLLITKINISKISIVDDATVAVKHAVMTKRNTTIVDTNGMFRLINEAQVLCVYVATHPSTCRFLVAKNGRCRGRFSFSCWGLPANFAARIFS